MPKFNIRNTYKASNKKIIKNPIKNIIVPSLVSFFSCASNSSSSITRYRSAEDANANVPVRRLPDTCYSGIV